MRRIALPASVPFLLAAYYSLVMAVQGRAQVTPAQSAAGTSVAQPAQIGAGNAGQSINQGSNQVSNQGSGLAAPTVGKFTASGKTAAAPPGPTDEKARQTFADAAALMKKHAFVFALDGYRKADKQDGGHCVPCEIQAIQAALQIKEYKAAREETALIREHVTSIADKAKAHYLSGTVCLEEGVDGNHEKALEAADIEFQASLQMQPNNADCLYGDGLALAHLKQDGAARERFQQFLKVAPQSDLDYFRAQRFAENPELARARVAPNFSVSAADGRTITLEGLTGKVVLIDFWATWCGPCREVLPHVKEIAKRFAGQPFVVISISMDKDEAKWREFIAKNEMSWIQYRDGYFEGPIAKMFGVRAIPATFTIDADGVLQDQHVGDAEIEGKLKKLIARAAELANKKAVAAVHSKPESGPCGFSADSSASSNARR
jgi:thiol-disulfide isomerase/thioredoxin